MLFRSTVATEEDKATATRAAEATEEEEETATTATTTGTAISVVVGRLGVEHEPDCVGHLFCWLTFHHLNYRKLRRWRRWQQLQRLWKLQQPGVQLWSHEGQQLWQWWWWRRWWWKDLRPIWRCVLHDRDVTQPETPEWFLLEPSRTSAR